MLAPVTVIVPCYCCTDTLARTVASIACQTMRPMQVILVDDGSPDGTPALLWELQRQYGADWIEVYVLSRNEGVSVARNIGWERASQPYIAFLDADDIWHPRKIELQYKWLSEHPALVGCGHDYILVEPGNSQPAILVDANYPTHPVSPDRLLYSNPFVTPAVMLRRELDYRFDVTKRYCEDYFLWLQIVLDGNSMMSLDVPLVFVNKRLGETGASRRLWQMRSSDINNYWRLWRLGKLDFGRMISAVLYSLFKFLLLLLVGPKHHFRIKKWLEQR